MTINVQINGIWKEVGKDITWEEYEEYHEIQNQKYSDKMAKKLGVDLFHFKVLDCTKGELGDTLIVRFPTSESLDNFIEGYVFNLLFEGLVSVKVLDESIGLMKLVVE